MIPRKMPTFLFLWLVVLLQPRMASAGFDTCGTYNDLTVRVVYEVPRLQKELSAQEIEDKRRSELRFLPQSEKGWPALVRFQPTLGVSAPLTAKKTAKDGLCWDVGSVQALHGFKDVVVEVAKDLASKGCGFDVIWKHQLEHIKAHKQFLHGLEPQIRVALHDFLSQPQEIRPIGKIDAQYELERKLSQIVKKVWEKEVETNKEAQKAVDNPAEMALIKKACDGAIAKQIQK
jgi:hypothetical protein